MCVSMYYLQESGVNISGPVFSVDGIEPVYHGVTETGESREYRGQQ